MNPVVVGIIGIGFLIFLFLFLLRMPVAFASGISQRLYKATYTWVGHLRGGLTIGTVFACAGFGADDLRKVRGVLFSPKTVEEVLRKDFQEIEEFEIVLERRGLMDVITLRAEVDRCLKEGIEGGGFMLSIAGSAHEGVQLDALIEMCRYNQTAFTVKA